LQGLFCLKVVPCVRRQEAALRASKSTHRQLIARLHLSAPPERFLRRSLNPGANCHAGVREVCQEPLNHCRSARWTSRQFVVHARQNAGWPTKKQENRLCRENTPGSGGSRWHQWARDAEGCSGPPKSSRRISWIASLGFSPQLKLLKHPRLYRNPLFLRPSGPFQLCKEVVY
jgi:hypothetical protein